MPPLFWLVHLPAQRISPGSPRGCWPRPGPRRTRPQPRRRGRPRGSGRTARAGARQMVSRQGSIFVTPLGPHGLIPAFALILKLKSILSLKKFWAVWFPFPELFWIILSLTQGAETEDPEDILGAGYWAQQPVWDTARSAASLSWYHYHGIIHPPLAFLASQVICRNRTIYYNFFQQLSTAKQIHLHQKNSWKV